MFSEQFFKSLERNLANRPLCAVDAPEGAVRAAVMVVIRLGSGGAELCFIKRAACPLDRFSGHMAFPGGVREANDPDMLSTAVRETFEETGMRLDLCGRVAGRLDDETPKGAVRKFDRSYLVTPFVCVLVSDSPAHARDEVERIFWMPVAGLERRAAAQPAEFFCRGQRIWGMTGRIVEKLLKVIP